MIKEIIIAMSIILILSIKTKQFIPKNYFSTWKFHILVSARVNTDHLLLIYKQSYCACQHNLVLFVNHLYWTHVMCIDCSCSHNISLRIRVSCCESRLLATCSRTRECYSQPNCKHQTYTHGCGSEWKGIEMHCNTTLRGLLL